MNKHNIKKLYNFVIFVAKKFQKENCLEIANSLSYTFLLSIVPLMAVIFSGLSSFPVFQEMLSTLEDFIFSNFIPTSSEVIREYLMSFVGKASGLPLIGIISILVIALLLMWKIDQVLNHIWDVSKKRDYLRTFLTYWAILTLGPILIGLSLMATSYLTSLPIINDTVQTIGIKKYLLQLVASVFTLVAFSLTYLVVPNTRVSFKHALIGGVVATILFELSKQGFAIYVSSNKTYENIYGALSTIPIFLIWIYVSWVVILIGAITARSMELFSFSNQSVHNQNEFVMACYIIYFMWLNSQRGEGIYEYEFMKQETLNKGKKLSRVLFQLEIKNWIHLSDDDKWYLSRDLTTISFKNLYNELGFDLPNNLSDHFLNDLLKPIYVSNSKHLDTNIKTYFTEQNNTKNRELI
jgi:membrane protein